ncbi:DoxX family protein [Halopiger xanaduensis]|uniref:DoxX family protein n=1 Tax=Halopiger xanaduensis (strain DSM 18323 / JCM 14033 / SH-6) TaxID=797210 RepID=F8DBZ9_HALXS|nr:DoxX family protein [Halopiger xanaduensis]AEH35976.1 DoxX family protein [Halopiger xanaduensis SH-6]
MATEKMTVGANVFESKVGGMTVRGKAHSLSAWFVLALRLMMGYAFLYAGLGKLLAAEPFSAEGFLLHGVNQASPLVGLFTWMGTTPWFVEIVNVAVPFGQVAIGLGLLVGAMVRLAAFFGATMMFMFYFANWSVEHGLINGDFAYLLVFLAVAAFGAGRILGLDALIERYEIDGQPLLEKYPKLDYILG